MPGTMCWYGDSADTVVGTRPEERPTPALSSRITSRSAAMSSTKIGSQLSRFPRKCCKKTSGGASLSVFPKRRYA
jgi:hypothetical protein